MLYGEYEHTLDAKGRLTMPSRFRDELGEKFMLTRGTNGCLFIFPAAEWASFSEKLRLIPTTDQVAQQFLRLLFAGACECETDKQGRILLPLKLRQHAGIEKDAVIIGAFNRAEIWSREGWEAYSREASESFDDVLAKTAQLGI